MATLWHAESQPLSGCPLFVILDVFGTLFFAPEFGDFDHFDQDFPIGQPAAQVLPSFTWPAGVGEASGILWYAALTDPAITQLFGDYDVFAFSWIPAGVYPALDCGTGMTHSAIFQSSEIAAFFLLISDY